MRFGRPASGPGASFLFVPAAPFDGPTPPAFSFAGAFPFAGFLSFSAPDGAGTVSPISTSSSSAASAIRSACLASASPRPLATRSARAASRSLWRRSASR